MDKKLMAARKPPMIKSRGNLPPTSSFIALGNRPATPETSSGIKRELSQSGLVGLPTKKLRLGLDIDASIGIPAKREVVNDAVWQSIPSDVTPVGVMERINVAESKGKREKVEKLICALVKLLHDNRLKAPDPLLVAVLCYLAKEKASYFYSESVTEAFCALLRRQMGLKAASLKTHKVFYSAITSILATAFEDKSNWPEMFVKVYLDDALSDRMWVDRSECSKFVEILENAFGSEKPSMDVVASLFMAESRSSATPASEALHSPQRMAHSPSDDHDSGGSSSRDALTEDQMHANETSANLEAVSDLDVAMHRAVVKPSPNRFTNNAESIRRYTVELLRDMWSRRPDSLPKSLLKTMSACCGYSEVRLAASQKLDGWLQNAKVFSVVLLCVLDKFQRVSVELLLSMCLNCKEQTTVDIEVIQNLIKLRLKSKPMINSFCVVLRELFHQNVNYLGLILKLVIHNELSIVNRANYNMVIVGCCFQYNQQLSAQILADVCFEFLTMKDDYIRALRSLLKEIVRVALKFDFPFVQFCEALSLEKADRFNPIAKLDALTKDRIYKNLEDLITLAAFLGISPSVKEAAIALTRGDKKDVGLVKSYQQQLSIAQVHCVVWLQNVVPIMFKPNKQDYINSFLRIFFLEKPDYYSSKDNWPSEQERNLFLKIVSDTALNEETMQKVLIIGLSSNLPLTPAAAIELMEQLIRRAALASAGGKFHADGQLLALSKTELIDLLLNSCKYRGYEGFPLPNDYKPPVLAITVSYWRTMLILLIFACHNPSFVGRMIWCYPTLCIMMQMIMTDDFTFPPASAESESLSCDEIKRNDLQAFELERQAILELETYLTNETITDSNSKILSQLMRLDMSGPARRPPQSILDQLKSLNQTTNLGLLLCHSRDPDFLLEIINKQGASHSLPWLVQLIQKNEGSLSMLPIQCLCEFLLHQVESQQVASDEHFESDSSNQQSSNFFNEQRTIELRQRLRKVLWNPTSELGQVEQTLMYFVNRLQADTSFDRSIAANALDFLTKKHESLSYDSNSSLNWIDNLHRLPHFESLKTKISTVFLKCCYIETDPSFVHAYANFLSIYMSPDYVDDAAVVLAKMICDRKTFFELLFVNRCHDVASNVVQTKTFEFVLEMFKNHMTKARKPQANLMSWSTNQEQLFVQWGDLSAVVNVQVVAAIMFLLALDKPDNFASPAYDVLMEMWFPSESSQKPTAFLVDTTEEADLIPDWVKVRLLNSSHLKIVDCVISTLEQSQIILFLQTYGLPIENVSKLLHCLDEITKKNELSLLLDDQNKEHNLKLLKTVTDFVNSYRTLGATGGDVYLEIVNSKLRNKKAEESENVILARNQSDGFSDESMPTIETSFCIGLEDVCVDGLMKSLLKIDKEEVFVDFTISKNLTSLLITCAVATGERRNSIFQTIFGFVSSYFEKKSVDFVKLLNENVDRFCLVLRAVQNIVEQDVSLEDRKRFVQFCRQLLDGDFRLDPILVNVCRQIVDSQKVVTASSADIEMIDLEKADVLLQNALKKVKIVNQESDANEQLIEPDYFEVDILTHRLLVGFANLADLTRAEQKLEGIECVLRRLATHHPKLLVRQLPLIAALLRGKTAFAMRKYYNSSYLIYFVMILELLESLRPLIFDRIYTDAFMDIANSFFDFIENHCLRNPKMLVIVDKVLALLKDFHGEDPEMATKYLETWAPLIQMISIRYPEMVNLRTLMARVNLPLAPVCLGPMTSSSDAPGASTSTVDTFELKPLPYRPSSPVTTKEVESLHSRLKKADSTEEVMSALKDVSDLYTKKTDSLAFFKIELERLVTHRSRECCRLAFELLMKYFRQFPREAANFLPKYLSCFDVQNGAGKVALSFLPTFCRVYSGDPGILLQNAFTWGVRNLGKEVTPYLCDAVCTIHQNCLDV